MKMIKSRQLASYTYNEETANEIYFGIVEKYFDTFNHLNMRMEQEKNKEL